jgi:hypothetical protein
MGLVQLLQEQEQLWSVNKKYQVFDWYGNDVGSPVFEHWEDACDWITETIDKVYGELSDNDHDIQRDEYQIIELD